MVRSPGRGTSAASATTAAPPRPRSQPCQNGWVDVIPVRRDGTGRLVAVGLIEAADAHGEARWTTISAIVLPGDTIEQAIERCVKETLGSDAHGQFSKRRPVGIIGTRVFGQREDPRLRPNPGEINEPCAVEIWGKLEPHGVARRFAWFLVTALPARGGMASEQWALLADFLEGQGEPGLAARMRQF
jgi:Domain of unknown function (DUF4916)